MLVSDLKTALKKYGFNDSDPLLQWLNAAMHTIEDEYPHWSWLERTEVGTLSSGGSPNGRFQLEGDASRIVKIRDITDEANLNGRDLVYWDRRKFIREIENQFEEGEYPTLFTILGSDTLQVHPVPGSSRELESVYIEELDDLVSDSDEPKLPRKNHYLLVQLAAAIALQAENEEDRAANALQIANTALEKMVEADRKRQIGQPATVADTAGYTTRYPRGY